MDISYQAMESACQSVRYSPWINRLGLILADIAGFTLAFILSFWLFSLWRADGQSSLLIWFGSDTGNIRLICFTSLMIIGIARFWVKLRHYTYRKPFWSELREMLLTLTMLAVLDLALVAFSKWDFSPGRWALLWMMALLFVPLGRYLMKCLLTMVGVWQWPALIIGCGQNARDAYLALQSECVMGFNIVGFVSPDDECSVSPVFGIPLLGSDVFANIESILPMQFFLAVDYEQRELRDNWLRLLAQHGVRNVSVIPTLRGVPLYGTDISHFFSHEVLMLRIRNNLARLSSRILKRAFDIVASGLALLMLSPLLLYIGWKVSRDGGSPIYGHERVGQHGRLFKCLKFRSMIINSQQVLQELLDRDPEARVEWEKDFKLKNDPRITSIGHFIRKTSLDELPQLWNVFKGEMSLVGPRPVVAAELERYGKDAEYYLLAKPGISGLWQVSGRNDIDYDTRVYLDGWYVKNWSLWYDIAILFKTVGVVLRRDGAY